MESLRPKPDFLEAVGQLHIIHRAFSQSDHIRRVSGFLRYAVRQGTEIWTYFVPVFVIHKVDASNKEKVLEMAPLVKEEDLSAKEQFQFINATFDVLGWSLTNVVSFVSDNCRANRNP